jgi:hypothetical protein
VGGPKKSASLSVRDQSAPERCDEKSWQRTGVGAVRCKAFRFGSSAAVDGRKSEARSPLVRYRTSTGQRMIRAIGVGHRNGPRCGRQIGPCACSETPSPVVLRASGRIDRSNSDSTEFLENNLRCEACSERAHIRHKSNGRRGIRTCDFHRVRMVRKTKNLGK